MDHKKLDELIQSCFCNVYWVIGYRGQLEQMHSYQTSHEKMTELKACIHRVACERDKQAFAKLFDHYAPLIKAYSLAREPGADLLADELVQEVMTRVWLKADKYKANLANLNTWVFTLARIAALII